MIREGASVGLEARGSAWRAVVIERALHPGKCEAVRAEMAPYVAEAAEEQWLLLDSEGKPSTSAGACASGCVLARSPASWDFAQHPLILVEPVGRPVIGEGGRETSSVPSAELLLERVLQKLGFIILELGRHVQTFPIPLPNKSRRPVLRSVKSD